MTTEDTYIGLRLTRLADVEPEEVHWRWLHRIPEGKLTLLEGDPGEGKSFLTLAIATAVTLGNPLLGDSGAFEPRDVLIFSAEDGKADTIRPRLEALGADLERVWVVDGCIDGDGQKRWPNLKEDLPYIEDVLAIGNVGLVVIDPINAYLGDTDGNQDTKIRGILGPLAEMAEHHDTVILPIRHLAKSQRDKAIYRGLGSIGYVGAARSVLLAGRNPDDETERVLICIKHNLAPDSSAITYEIDASGRFFWRGESSLTAKDILSTNHEESRTGTDDAKDFLLEVLADGPMPAKPITQQAESIGITKKALWLAKEALGAESKALRQPGKKGVQGWLWQLPGGLDGLDSLEYVRESRNLNPRFESESDNSLGGEGNLNNYSEIPWFATGTGNNEWYTPPEYVEAARRVLGAIDLDPASCEQAQMVVKAARYFTIEEGPLPANAAFDGLAQPWAGRLFMNPPYARGLIDQFATKLTQHYQTGDIEGALVLTFSSTETAWYRQLDEHCTALCFTSKRVKFWGSMGSSPPAGCAIFYFGPDPALFEEVFKDFGAVYVKANVTSNGAKPQGVINPDLCPGGCGKAMPFGMMCTACRVKQEALRFH
jgi:hypothetical protein